MSNGTLEATQQLQDDLLMMERAIDLSMQARLLSPPNPWVGCVIVNQGTIVGEGYTQPPGSAHAEVVALKQAGANARGATVYTTLEPCSHFGRTPPCVGALINAGVSRVVVGIQDPDVQVQGKGIEQLRQAGIDVIQGVHEEAISSLLVPYLHHRRTGLPYCVLKAAISVDGRVAAYDGTSKWITSTEARLDSYQIRAESQAILIGAGTACIDQPSLTVRDLPQLPLRPPLRVVVDGEGRVPVEGPLFDTSLASTLIITTSRCPVSVKDSWKKFGVEVETVGDDKNGRGVDLRRVLSLLGQRGVLQLMVEGGGKLLGAFLDSRLAQHLSLYVGGCALGSLGHPLFSTDSIANIKEAPRFTLTGVKKLGNNARLDYDLESDIKGIF